MSIGSGNGLAPNRRQAVIWTNADPLHWRLYVALGGDELTMLITSKFWMSFFITGNRIFLNALLMVILISCLMLDFDFCHDYSWVISYIMHKWLVITHCSDVNLWQYLNWLSWNIIHSWHVLQVGYDIFLVFKWFLLLLTKYVAKQKACLSHNIAQFLKLFLVHYGLTRNLGGWLVVVIGGSGSALKVIKVKVMLIRG